MAPAKIAINGAAGRMGRRLCALAHADPDVELVQVCAVRPGGRRLAGATRYVRHVTKIAQNRTALRRSTPSAPYHS